MPKLSELRSPQFPGPVIQPPEPHFVAPIETGGLNPFLRCTMPPINPVSVDNLRQFYRGGTAQTRLLAPSNQ